MDSGRASGIMQNPSGPKCQLLGQLHPDFIACRTSFTVRGLVSWYKPMSIFGEFLHLVHIVIVVAIISLPGWVYMVILICALDIRDLQTRP